MTWALGLGPGQWLFSYTWYKLQYIVGFSLVEMAISTNQKPTIYRNLYENTAPAPNDFHPKQGGKCANNFSILVDGDSNTNFRLERDRSPNVGLMLSQRRRQWLIIKPTLVQRSVSERDVAQWLER